MEETRRTVRRAARILELKAEIKIAQFVRFALEGEKEKETPFASPEMALVLLTSRQTGIRADSSPRLGSTRNTCVHISPGVLFREANRK